MKFAPPPVSISDVSLFLFVLFGGLVYLSPWFAVPSTAILAAWAIDRLKERADVTTYVTLLQEAELRLDLATVKEEDIKERLKELQGQVDNVRTNVSMRFK